MLTRLKALLQQLGLELQPYRVNTVPDSSTIKGEKEKTYLFSVKRELTIFFITFFFNCCKLEKLSL